MSRTRPPKAVRSILYIHWKLRYYPSNNPMNFLATNVTKKLDHNTEAVNVVARRILEVINFQDVNKKSRDIPITVFLLFDISRLSGGLLRTPNGSVIRHSHILQLS